MIAPMPYTKLDAGIIFSTIWREPHTTVRVWITMLAMKNRRGEVLASVPGLADVARVTIAECAAALATFQEPDEYSRTQDNDGRRIERIEGGWLVLNHEKYRNLEDTDDRRRKNAIRQQRHRDRRNGVTRDETLRPVTNVIVAEKSRQADTHTHAHADAQNSKDLTTFRDTWDAYPRRFGGNSRADAERQWNARVRSGVEPSAILAGVQRYAAYCAATGKTNTEFVQAAKTFFGRGRHWEESWEIPPAAKGALDFGAAARAVEAEDHGH